MVEFLVNILDLDFFFWCKEECAVHHSFLTCFAVGSEVELTVQWLLLRIPVQKYLLHAL